jgi:hypothetical protein
MLHSALLTFEKKYIDEKYGSQKNEKPRGEKKRSAEEEAYEASNSETASLLPINTFLLTIPLGIRLPHTTHAQPPPQQPQATPPTIPRELATAQAKPILPPPPQC